MRKDITEKEVLSLLDRLERFADLTDSKFKIPGTNIPIGLDALIGLIPIFGEIVGAALSFYLLVEANKIGVPLSIKIRMLINIFVDFLIGLIPVIGDIADIGFRSNLKNVRLIVEHVQKEHKSSTELSNHHLAREASLLTAALSIGVIALIVAVILIIMNKQAYS